MSNFQRKPPPFAVTADGWYRQPSNQAYATSKILHGNDLSRHKEELNKVRTYIQHCRGHDVASGSSRGPRPSSDTQVPRDSNQITLRLDKGVGLGARGGLASTPAGDTCQPPGRGWQGLPGRNNNDNPGDVFPQASRGIPNGGMPMWSFERMPSLMQSPLMRDTCKRGVAGAPPTTLSPPPQALQGPLSRGVGGSVSVPPRHEPLTPGSASTRSDSTASCSRGGSTPGTMGSRRMHSQPDLRGRGPGGLHGIIGMGWDDAKTCAGGAYRGAGGNFVGF
mmetsp:Transcript_73388/g.203766  ORF Transcript_73388/g.203766 Transcript_73388/m.203766 type:complete len:278 (-) Transcript_73388:112-945(-)